MSPAGAAFWGEAEVARKKTKGGFSLYVAAGANDLVRVVALLAAGADVKVRFQIQIQVSDSLSQIHSDSVFTQALQVYMKYETFTLKPGT